VIAAFEKQIDWCESMGAPFTASVLRVLVEEFGRLGWLADTIGTWPGDPVADALALRFAGAFHALVLAGRDPDLAACYPGGDGSANLRAALPAALVRHEAFIRAFLRSPPQTNEPGRSAVLLGGFLRIAARTGLPFRLLEIGASAGLNMIWDRYAYDIGGRHWGDAASAVRLRPAWSGPLPPLDASVVIASRAGCDVSPLDLALPETRLRLRSYVWADQPDRLARVEAAIGVAVAENIRVERADAAAWAARELAAAAPGHATVLYHSIMWQYLPAETRGALRSTIENAGARATADAPVAWLRFEPPTAEDHPELRLTCWPGGVEQQLATAHPHGNHVTWHASDRVPRASNPIMPEERG
jgi:hypothetical protein